MCFSPSETLFSMGRVSFLPSLTELLRLYDFGWDSWSLYWVHLMFLAELQALPSHLSLSEWGDQISGSVRQSLATLSSLVVALSKLICMNDHHVTSGRFTYNQKPKMSHSCASCIPCLIDILTHHASWEVRNNIRFFLPEIKSAWVHMGELDLQRCFLHPPPGTDAVTGRSCHEESANRRMAATFPI